LFWELVCLGMQADVVWSYLIPPPPQNLLRGPFLLTCTRFNIHLIMNRAKQKKLVVIFSVSAVDYGCEDVGISYQTPVGSSSECGSEAQDPFLWPSDEVGQPYLSKQPF
jgi:hypothetical protein